MDTGIIIRLFRPGDREAIRKICCDTADRGEPVENFFHDREIVADAVTSYYTDYEPSSLWVAEYEGRVIGYLCGSLDTRRYMRVMAFRFMPKILLRALMRGVFFYKDTWVLLGGAIKASIEGGLKREIDLDKYPVHLHIDIEKGFRGRGIGKELLQNFTARITTLGAKGIHLSTLRENAAACRFFEGAGFTEIGRYPAVNTRDRSSKAYTIVYGKALA